MIAHNSRRRRGAMKLHVNYQLIKAGVCFLAFVPHFSAFGLAAPEIYRSNKDSVFTVRNKVGEGSLGSGVVIAQEKTYSLLATNCHVVNGARTVTVKNHLLDAEADVLHCDKSSDVAIVRVPKSLSAVPTASRLPPVGSSVYAIGSPRGLEMSMSQGIVSQIRKVEKSDQTRIQSTAAIEPGSSGGGLFDSNGRLVGLTTSKIVNTQGLNFAIPIADVLASIATVNAQMQGVASSARPAGQKLRRSTYTVKDFPIGGHCSDSMEAAKRLDGDGFRQATNAKQFCSPGADDENHGMNAWTMFSMNERKAIVVVTTDDNGLINKVSYTDTWSYQSPNAPPLPDALATMLVERYGTPIVVREIEQRSKGFWGPDVDEKEKFFLFTTDALSSVLLQRLASVKSVFGFEAILADTSGDFVTAAVTKRSQTSGVPHSVSLHIQLFRTATLVIPANPAIRF